MRALVLTLSLLVTGPALATDDTDVDSWDTDAAASDLSGQTASELAGDEGGLACSSVGASALGLPLLLVGVAAMRRRRPSLEA